MDLHTPLGTIVLTGSLSLVFYLLYNMSKTFIVAKDSLAEVGTGLLEGFLVRLAEAEKSKTAFYKYPWKPAEAHVMLKELKRQLTNRRNLINTPELAAFGKEDAAILLALAVFTKAVISTEEIYQRIVFLELVIARDQESQSEEYRLLVS